MDIKISSHLIKKSKKIMSMNQEHHFEQQPVCAVYFEQTAHFCFLNGIIKTLTFGGVIYQIFFFLSLL